MTNPSESDKIRVTLFGLGSIGAAAARVLLDRPDYQIVGAIDIHPSKAGCDLGRVVGLRQDLGIVVSNETKKTLALPSDLVLHATSSYLAPVMPELQAIIRAGHNVVSTCEELAEPWTDFPDLAADLDRLARRMGVSVLGTGINPGFAMDAWPLSLTATCQEVTHIRVRRVVDAARRRVQLQKKIGTGMSRAAFEEAVNRREVRHVGLRQSAALLARGLGWKLDQLDEQIEPVLATRRVVTDHYTVDPRFVTGVHQVVRGVKDKVERLRLELQISVDAPESTDEVWIEGRPTLYSQIKGIHGDISTAAVVANAARRVVAAPSGLLTMLDLPVISAW